MWRMLARLALKANRARVWLTRRLRLCWSDATTALLTMAIFGPAVYIFDVHPLAAVWWCFGVLVLASAHASVRQMERDAKIREQIDTHLTEILERMKEED